MKKVILGGLLLSLLALNAALLSDAFRREPPLLKASKPDYSGGATVQRERIEKYIEKVAGADYETLVKDLNKYEVLLVFAESRSQDPVPELTFEVCLANRRLAAIYSVLKEQDSQRAATASRKVFDEKLEVMKADWERGLHEWEELGGSKKPIPVTADYHAASAALFLVAAFSDSEVLLDCVDRWTEFSAGVWQRVEAKESMKPLENEARRRAGLELLFTLNLYLWHLTERYHAGTIDSIMNGLTRRPMEHSIVPFVAWDGHTNASDFTHIHTMVPVDSTKIIRTFDVCRSWDSGMVVKDEDKRDVVAAVRRKLESVCRRQN